MEKVILAASARTDFGRCTNKGRKNGLVPAVVYGRGITTQSLWVKTLDLSRLLEQSGESTVIELAAEGAKKRNVLIYDIQRNPVTGKIIHADFFQVRMDEEIETEVELVYVGESPAVRDLGGVLVKNMAEIEVKCLPGNLPSHINVDISVLKTFVDHIYAKDLKIPEKVSIDLDLEAVIALVTPPRSEEELAELSEKVEEDVTKVEGVVKEPALPTDGKVSEEGEGEKEGERAEKKEEKKE